MMVAGVGRGLEEGAADKKGWGAGEIFGTTDPTLGTGDEIRGDMEGMAASWERSVTSAPPALAGLSATRGTLYTFTPILLRASN